MKAEIAERLARLRSDTLSGAVHLAVQAIDLALSAPESRADIARELRSMHPAIITVANVGRLLEQGAGTAELTALRESLLGGNRRISEHLSTLLAGRPRVITLSNSSTVETALRSLETSRIVVLESLPGGEGRTLAAGLAAEWIPDSAMGRVAAEIDVALVGIDAFDDAGAILHKIGTLPLALCCAHFGKPFYAAGHSFKRSAVATAMLLERAGRAAEGFDRTPPELVTRIVTEQGPV